MDKVYLNDTFVGVTDALKSFKITTHDILPTKAFNLPTADSITFSLDLTLQSPPIRKVRPEEAGVFLPGLKWIGLNGCPGEGKHYGGGINTFQLGHAHICPKDPNIGMICTMEKWLKNSDGTYSETLLHELAHVITDYDMKVISCGENIHTHEFSIKSQYIDEDGYGHGPKWKEWAIKLGIPPRTWGNPPR